MLRDAKSYDKKQYTFSSDAVQRYKDLANKKAQQAKEHGDVEAMKEAIGYKKREKEVRRKRAAWQMAENERAKNLENLKKRETQIKSSKEARDNEKKRRQTGLYKATKSFTSSWKLGADDIKKTASKGASFVKNLFK